MTQAAEPFDPYYHWLGIPPDEQPPNHYRLLGINRLEENREVIQNAADRQMAHLRTFQTGPRAALSQKLLNEVSAARVCLLSAEKKRAYDQQLRVSTGVLEGKRPDASGRAVVTPPAMLLPLVGDESSREVDTPLSLPLGSPGDRLLARGTSTPSVRRTGPRRPAVWPYVLAGAVACALFGGLAVLLWWPKALPTPTGARVVFRWPVSERSDATMEIDGRTADLTMAAVVADDRIELELTPGVHTYRITRPGAKPLEGTFSLADAPLDVNVLLPPAREASTLVLRWNETERAGRVLAIDGLVVDMKRDVTASKTDYVSLELPAGEHRLSIVQDGETLLSREFVLDSGSDLIVPIDLSGGQLLVRWDRNRRDEAQLLLDGQPVDLAADKVMDTGNGIMIPLSLGEHTVGLERDGVVLLQQSVDTTAGKRTTVNVDALLDKPLARIWLEWPLQERDGARLELDGRAFPISGAGDTTDAAVALEVPLGEHVLRIVQPQYEDFEHTLTAGRDEVRVPVTRMRSGSREVSSDQLEGLRAECRAVYRQYEEYGRWQRESDAEAKRELLGSLVSKVRAAGLEEPPQSAERYAALLEAYYLALENDDVSLAHDVLTVLREAGSCSETEWEQLDDRVVERAIDRQSIEAMLEFLVHGSGDARKLNESQQKAIVAKILSSPRIAGDYMALERAIGELVDSELLSSAIGLDARLELAMAATKVDQPGTDHFVRLGEQLVEYVPEIVERATDESRRQATAALDAVNTCRRKVAADRQVSSELKERAEGLSDSIKELRDLISQFSRAAEAEQAIAAGTATTTQHRLLGLWLLQRGEYDRSLPHLRASGDESLAAVASSPPETASDLLSLADSVEAESKKSKYSKRNESALLGYTLHLRQLALSRSDGTLDEDTRTMVERSVTGPATDWDWKRTPRGKWVKLTDIFPLETLREMASSSSPGRWSVLDDGTIVTGRLERAQLELPMDLPGSYGIRFICRRTTGENVNVNLPLGDRSVLFTLGAFASRFSGLQMVDGRFVNDAENGAAIKRSEFNLRRDVPAHVEIHVELLPVASQSSKQKKLTGSNDWTTITMMIDGRLVKRVSAATSRFAMDDNFRLSHDVLGLSANAVVAYGSIELVRL